MKLKKYLEIYRISQYKFAGVMNTSTANVARWTNDKCIPSLRYLKKIKEITGGRVTADDFYEGKQ